MKAFALICLIPYLLYSEVLSSHQEFVHWKNKFGKRYANTKDAMEAYNNFVEATNSVDQHNENFKKGLANFQISLNRFADFSQRGRQQISSGFRETPAATIGRTVTVIGPDMYPPAPDSVDWKEQGYCTPVKDQGYFCNCCWAFSAVAALECQYLFKYNRSYDISEQFLIDCNRNNRTGNWGCDGGSQGPAYVYMTNVGIETSETYPYKEWLPHEGVYQCTYNSTNSIGQLKGYKRIKPKDEETLKRAVYYEGPIAFAFCGSLPSFMYYEHGVYDDPECPNDIMSHSAVIVGYGTLVNNGTEIPYWLCKNSWSDGWGEAGYFKIVRGKNMCGMTSYLIKPDV